MKTKILIFIFSIFATSLFAQGLQILNKEANFTPVEGTIKKDKERANQTLQRQNQHNSSQTITSFVIDYDLADSIAQTTMGNSYFDSFYGFYFNKNRNDTEYTAVAVVFDSLYDYTTGTGYPKNAVQQVTVDSVFVMLSQENNSGTADTLIVYLADVAENGSFGGIYYKVDTVIFPPANPLDTNWNYYYNLKFTFGDAGNTSFAIPDTAKNFSIYVSYRGNLLDSAGFGARFGYNGNCPGTSNPKRVYKSYFSPVDFWPDYTNNTYFVESNNYGQYPRTNAAGTTLYSGKYINCDGVTGYTFGSDGEWYIQNALITAYVTLEHTLGIATSESNKLILHNPTPNPVQSETTIEYELTNPDEISLDVKNVLGQVVKNITLGTQNTGKHQIKMNGNEFSNGVYFYTLHAGNLSLTKKMVVSH